MRTRSWFVPVACWAVCVSAASAADWPQWRGPNRDDVSKETGLLKSWPKNGPPLLWTFKDAGIGFSGPAVVGDRLYTMGAREDTEYLFALDTATGKEVWATKLGPRFKNPYGDGPRSTPTVDGDWLYVFSPGEVAERNSQGELVCLEKATGKIKWQHEVKKDFGGQQMSVWGYSESPLIDGDHLIFTPGGKQGTLAALDKKTGEVVWRSKELTDAAAYSSVVIAEVGGVRQYIQQTGQAVVGVAAKDGKLLWRQAKPVFRTAIIPTPIVHGDNVYVTAGYGVGCDLFKLTPVSAGTKAERIYDADTRKTVENKHGGVVLVGEHVYGWTDADRGKWVCQELKTGKIVWESKALGRGSVTYAEGMLYCYSEADGTAVLAEASPAGWKEHGRFKIPEKKKPGSIWTHPVVANGKLFLRDQELLYCFDIRDKVSLK
jgi:outer membrane protein assembly factor BamB